ncbi:MAG: prolipoprotein diacylglyceryl transferase, partial [Anaerolineae bacterium]|nr:prolipoprotein diacylglyceryl transferase [Anaerolineae bacterium]
MIGFWLGLTLAERHAQRHKIHADLVYNLAFVTLISGILGARLAYAA